MYGPYFAYLLRRFSLRNAYFTNVIKCSLAPEEKDQFLGAREYPSHVRENCISRYLVRGITIVRPEVVFAFGKNVYQMLMSSPSLKALVPKVSRLFHPAAYIARATKIARNNETIGAALGEMTPRPMAERVRRTQDYRLCLGREV